MRHLATLLLATALALAPGALRSQGNCGPVDQMRRMLWNNFDERPVEGGVTVYGGLWQILTTRDGATWTLLAITPDGLSCIVGSGTDWYGVAS